MQYYVTFVTMESAKNERMLVMKRIIPVILIVCLLLVGCGKGGEDTNATTLPTITEATEFVPPATVETEPAVKYRNPLNGEALESPWTGRTTAVVINNSPSALPHHGVSGADFLYELEVEGGITRCLAVFTDMTGNEKIGPVRSARTFFTNISVSYDAPMVHCGGSHQALNGQYDDSGDTVSNWEHINEFYNGSYFFRDLDRYNYKGYAWEHCLFTSGELMYKCLDAKSYTKTDGQPTDYGLSFDDEGGTAGGETATKVYATFRGDKQTILTYNADTGLYAAYQYGSDYIDGNTGEVMRFRNILILKADQWKDGSGYRTFYDLIGEGEGLFACDGKIVPIKWSRPGLRENFRYTLEDGTPITLGVGTTYVAITSPKAVSTYE